MCILPLAARQYKGKVTIVGRASEREINEWLGHKEAGLVQRYRHLRNENAQRNMAHIDFLDAQNSIAGDTLQPAVLPSNADNRAERNVRHM
jgi:hypothetical protein